LRIDSYFIPRSHGIHASDLNPLKAAVSGNFGNELSGTPDRFPTPDIARHQQDGFFERLSPVMKRARKEFMASGWRLPGCAGSCLEHGTSQDLPTMISLRQPFGSPGILKHSQIGAATADTI